jgi:hypothetical protein
VRRGLVEQLQSLDVSSNVLVALTPPDRSARQASYSPDAKEVAFVQDGPDALEACTLQTCGRVVGAPNWRSLDQSPAV